MQEMLLRANVRDYGRFNPPPRLVPPLAKGYQQLPTQIHLLLLLVTVDPNESVFTKAIQDLV